MRHFFEKYRGGIGAKERFFYLAAAMVLNFVIMYGYTGFLYQQNDAYAQTEEMGAAASLLGAVLLAVLPALGLSLSLRNAARMQYTAGDDPHLWLKRALAFLLPGEIARFLLSWLLWFGYYTASSVACLIAAVRGMDALFQPGAAEHILFVLFYLPYLAVHLTIALSLYRVFWRMTARDAGETARDVEEGSTAMARWSERRARRKREKGYSAERMEKEERTMGVRQTAVQALLIFAFANLVGTVSNVVVLLFGHLTALPVTVYRFAETYSYTGYTEAQRQGIWFAIAALSTFVCFVFLAGLSMLVGGYAAQFQLRQGAARTVDRKTMAVSTAIGMGAYTAVCMAVAYISMPYLIMASPVQYIARFLGKGEMTLFVEDAFRFPKWIRGVSVLIFAGIMTAAVVVGYLFGHRRRMEEVERKKRDDALMRR